LKKKEGKKEREKKNIYIYESGPGLVPDPNHLCGPGPGRISGPVLLRDRI